MRDMRPMRQPLTAGQLIAIILGFIIIPPLLMTAACGLGCAGLVVAGNEAAKDMKPVPPERTQTDQQVAEEAVKPQ